MVKIATYGSLKTGFCFHDYIQGAVSLGFARIKGWDLHKHCWGNFPLIKKGFGTVKVELFEVTKEQFDRTNRMETNASYVLTTLIINGKKYSVWVWERKDHIGEKIESGEWLNK